MKNYLNCIVTICAVIFGSDETLLNVYLGNDFMFKRMSLIPKISHLNDIFETDAMGLRCEYESARIDDTLDVICLYKSYQICLPNNEIEEYYRKICDNDLIYLDNKIRAIRLFIEGPVRFTKLSFKLETEMIQMEGTKGSSCFKGISVIGEALRTRTIEKFHIDIDEVIDFNKNIDYVKFPFNYNLLNNCHAYYDLSYHQDNFISIVLLITCLELLFLDNENYKKEKLAKRCSVYLYDKKNERLNCYKKLKESYEKRCDFIHEGNRLSIKNEDIIYLRDCVRKSVLKYLNKQHNKKYVISEMKKIINSLDYLNDINN